MTDLTNKLVSNTYKQLILVSSAVSNTGVDTSLKPVQTGDGTNTALQVAVSAIKVTGDAAVSGNVSVRGNIHADDRVCASAFYGDGSNITGVTATIAGNISVSNAVVGGNLQVSGTTTVVGATHLKAAVSVGGAAQFGSTVTVSGAAQFNSTVTAVGAATFKSTVTVENALAAKNNVTVGGTFNVAGTGTFTSKTEFKNDVSVSGRLDVATSASVGGTFRATGNAGFSGAVSVSGGLVVGDTVTILGTNLQAASARVCASAYYGDGSNLTNLPGGEISGNISVNGIIAGGDVSIAGNLTAVGTQVKFENAGVCASAYYGDGSNLTGITAELITDGRVGGSLAVSAALSVGSTLNVGGATSIGGNTTFAGTLDVAGETNFSERVTIDHNDKGWTRNGNADDLVIMNSGSVGINVLGDAATGSAWLLFGNETDSSRGGINYVLSTDTLYISTAGPTTALTLDSSQNATFAGDALFNGSTGSIYTSIDSGSLSIAGGNANNAGGNIILRGQSHSTEANYLKFRNGTTNALVIDGSQNATFAGDATISKVTPSIYLDHTGGTPRQIRLFADGTRSLLLNDSINGDLLSIANNGSATFSGPIGVNGATPNSSIPVTVPNQDYIAWYDSGTSGGTTAYIRGDGGQLRFGGSSYSFDNAVNTTFSGDVKLNEATPRIELYASGQTSDNKMWDLFVGGTSLQGRVLTDAGSGSAQWLNVLRSTNTISSIDLKTGSGTTALTLDSSQAATFSGTGHFGSGSGATANTSADDLVVEGSGNTGISIMSPNANSSNLYFASAADNNLAYLEAKDDGGTFKIGTTQTGHDVQILSGNNTLALTIDSSQNVGINNSSPVGLLHIKNTNDDTSVDTSVASLIFNHQGGTYTTGNYYNSIAFARPNSNGNSVGAFISPVIAGAASAHLAFGTDAGSGVLERMRINSSGNVGIGTTSPGAKLAVSGGNIRCENGYNVEWGSSSVAAWKGFSGASGYLIGYTNGSERMRITSGGNVGIGTSSPSTKLGFPIGNDIKISQVASTSHAAGNVGSLALSISDGGGQSGVFVNNTHDGSFSSQNISFVTAEGGVSVSTERMRITESGNVGIGTDSPSSYNGSANNLVVYENGNGGITIASNTTSSGSIYFADGTAGSEPYRGVVQYNHASDYMRFLTSGAERIRIDSNGAVGIGTSSPARDFHLYNSSGVADALIQGNSNDSVLYFGDSTQAIFHDYSEDELVFWTGSNALAIDCSTKAATFSGNIIADAATPQIIWKVSGTEKGYARVSSNTLQINATNDMALRTGGADALTIDSSQNATFAGDVILGTSGQKLTVAAGTTLVRHDGTNTFLGDATGETVRLSGGVVNIDGTLILQDLNASGTDTPEILFDANEASGRTSFYSGNPFCFIGATATTGGSSPFNEAGNLIIQSRTDVDRDIVFVTGATPAEIARVTQDGITFNGDTAAANALDDYEEGAFSPTLTTSGGGESVTYTTQDGYYTKIGRRVFFSLRLTLASFSGGSGNARIANLPYTASSATHGDAYATIAGNWSTQAPEVGLIVGGSTYIQLRYKNSATTFGTILQSNVGGTADVQMEGSYRV